MRDDSIPLLACITTDSEARGAPTARGWGLAALVGVLAAGCGGGGPAAFEMPASAGHRDASTPDGAAGASDAGAPDGATRDGDAPADGSDASSGALAMIPTHPKPTVETETFASSGDIADDSAIYADPNDPAASVVFADNKADTGGGIGVFDMKGHLLHVWNNGKSKIGNVDVRPDFPLGGRSIVLVGANNRSDNKLIFWQWDTSSRTLSAPIGTGTSTVSPNYGFCLYRSAASGKFYAFVTQETDPSTMEQYELSDDGGKVGAKKVRSFEVGSITEGCVADDELGSLYVAQEDVAVWRYGAEPDAGSSRTQVVRVGEHGLAADFEGLSLAKGPGNTGYLVVSSQGNNTFGVFDRQGNAFERSFTVGANGDIDAVSETDGLDISTANLGPGFEHGALVVHDGSNTGSDTSNLKYIPLVVP
jgi:3-phytase